MNITGQGDTESTTTGWQPALDAGQGIISGSGDIYNQMLGTNMPTLGNITANGNLTNAWGQMSGSGMTDMAGYLGDLGAGLMGDIGQVSGIYDQLGKGPNTYNVQNMTSTLMAGKQALLDDQNAAIMKDLEKASAQAVGQVYGNAAGGGNVGSSRTQLASGQATGNLAAGAQSTMANLASQSYDAAAAQAMSLEQQRLAGLQAQAAGIMGQANLGSNMINQAGNVYQQGINNMLTAGQGQMALDQMNTQIDYQNAMNQYNKPMELMSWYNKQVAPWASANSTTENTGNGVWGWLGF